MAAVCSLVHGAGFFIRGSFRIVTAIIRFDFSDIPDRVIDDFYNGLTCCVFTAATVFCVFASIFFPDVFGFYTPPSEPPPPIHHEPLSEAVVHQLLEDDDLAGSWVVTGPEGLRHQLFNPPPPKETTPQETSRLRALFERHENSSKWKKYCEAFRLYRGYAEQQRPFPRGVHPILRSFKILSEPQGHQNIRRRYHQFVELLRQAYISPECQNPQNEFDRRCRDLTLKMCHFRFAGVPIGKYNRELVELTSGPLQEELSLENLWETFLYRNTKLNQVDPTLGISEADRAFQKLQGHANIYFDPTKNTNLPRSLGRMIFSQDRHVQILQHGAPVMQMDAQGILARTGQSLIGSPQANGSGILHTIRKFVEDRSNAGTLVVPDYLGFLDSCQLQNQKILHIILEKKKRQILGDEGGRVLKRMALQNDYPDHFVPLALALDGDFFCRRASPAPTFEALKDQLIEKLLDANSEYSLPIVLTRDVNLASTLEELFSEVQELFFPNQADINSEEDHKGFILLCYSHLIFYMIDRFDISILEAICKDDIDRGNVIKAILFLYFLHLAGRENDPDSLRWILVNTLAAPMIVKKQGVLPDRANFLRIALMIFNRMAPQSKETLRTGRFGHMGAEALEIEIDPLQTIYPFGPTAETEEEYRLFLEHLFQTTSWSFPSSTFNVVEDMARGPAFLKDGQLSETNILHQIDVDIRRTKTKIDGNQIDNSAVIKPYLISKGLTEDEALKVMCCFQQGLSVELLRHFYALFNNPSLGMLILDDNANGDDHLELEINLHADEGIASLEFINLARLIRNEDETDVIARFAGLMTIADHRTGIANYRWQVRSQPD